MNEKYNKWLDDEWKMDNIRENLLEFQQEIRLANVFTISNQEMVSYKSEIANCIPENLRMTDKQITLMRYWENNYVESVNAINSIKDIIPTISISLNKNEEVLKWRKEYIQKIFEKSNELDELHKQALTIEKRKVEIENYYGLRNEDKIIIVDKSRQDSLKEAIAALFGEKRPIKKDEK